MARRAMQALRYRATPTGRAVAGTSDLEQLLLAMYTSTLSADELRAMLSAGVADLRATRDPEYAEAIEQQQRMASQLDQLLAVGVATGLIEEVTAR